MSEKWDVRFIGLARHVAGWSKDRSTKVGAVVVGPRKEVRSIGFNGMPRGVNDDIEERHQRPEKYLWMAHAEANCCFNAAATGTQLEGCTVYLASYPDKLSPCDKCCIAIIQSGIRRVVVELPDPSQDVERWRESFRVGGQMLAEAGVTVDFVKVP